MYSSNPHEPESDLFKTLLGPFVEKPCVSIQKAIYVPYHPQLVSHCHFRIHPQDSFENGMDCKNNSSMENFLALLVCTKRIIILQLYKH